MGKVTAEKIRQQESEIRQVIYGDLTENQRQTMRTVLANFKQKGYYAAHLRRAMENGTPLVEILEQLEEK